jgi:hypothetical protein
VVACALIAFAATWYNRRRYHQKAAKGVELPAERPHRMAELSHEPVVHEAPSMEQNMYRPPVELPATKR